MTKIIEPKKQRNIFSRPSSEEGVWSWITTIMQCLQCTEQQ
jgi:hypothetical protein